MRILTTLALSVTLITPLLHAQALTDTDRASIDTAVTRVLAETGTPSVSIGVARHGSVIFAKAYGDAILEERVASEHGGAMHPASVRASVKADAAMAYPIGSISKQFTAVCLLLLQERGKLKLDDTVSKWYPEFTGADKVTLRNLLTHTSGYSDYAPQDYTIPAWTRPVNSETLVREWATKPLDFRTGHKDGSTATPTSRWPR